MSPMIEPKIRFGAAAAAIPTTEKSFRKWLQNSEVAAVLSSEPDDRSWHSFSFTQIGLFAVMRKLVDFGIGVGDAAEFASLGLATRAKHLLKYRKTPPGAFAAVFQGMQMRIWHDVDDDDLRFDVARIGGTPPADAFLTIDLGTVISAAFARVHEAMGMAHHETSSTDTGTA
jgi:hypothetical protein